YFYLRAGASTWPLTPGLARPDVFPLVALNTLILLSSSFTAHAAAHGASRGRRQPVVRWLGITLTLGVLFLLIQVWEIAHLKFGPAEGIFGSTFYTLVSFHGLHVLVGALLLAGLLNRAARGLIDPRRHAGLDNVTAYWHFVDAVWLVLFTSVYVM
ncbi:MAG: heme-copper oxidase subunit III, partial [Chloroflexota bacterium]|nr:heme-copper oxidase subunit III [Chloroflexota bacterium]